MSLFFNTFLENSKIIEFYKNLYEIWNSDYYLLIILLGFFVFFPWIRAFDTKNRTGGLNRGHGSLMAIFMTLINLSLLQLIYITTYTLMGETVTIGNNIIIALSPYKDINYAWLDIFIIIFPFILVFLFYKYKFIPTLPYHEDMPKLDTYITLQTDYLKYPLDLGEQDYNRYRKEDGEMVEEIITYSGDPIEVYKNMQKLQELAYRVVQHLNTTQFKALNQDGEAIVLSAEERCNYNGSQGTWCKSLIEWNTEWRFGY